MDYTRITLRIPVDLHQELLAAAEENSRSMNAEIIARLRQSDQSLFGNNETITKDEVRKMITEALDQRLSQKSQNR